MHTAKRKIAIVFVVGSNLARLVQELDCNHISARSTPWADGSLLRGGSETQGWSSLNDSAMEERRNRRPVSYVQSFLAMSHRPHLGSLPSPGPEGIISVQLY